MGSSKNFDKLRKKIDSLDREILNLLNERGDIALEIRELKMENSVGVYDPVREKIIEKKLKELNKGPLSDDSVLESSEKSYPLLVPFNSKLKFLI